MTSVAIRQASPESRLQKTVTGAASTGGADANGASRTNLLAPPPPEPTSWKFFLAIQR